MNGVWIERVRYLVRSLFHLLQEQTRRGNHERKHFQSVSLVLYLLVFTFPGLVRFKNVSARSTALRSALPLLFFSPESRSKCFNALLMKL